MRCPNPKCKKKGELRTRRTIANGRTVQRERICPVCGQRADTIEMFMSDVEDTRRAYDTKIMNAEGALSEKTEQLEDLTYHFQQIFRICGAGKE